MMSEATDESGSAPRRRPRRPSPTELLARASDQFTDVTGNAVESVSALHRTGNGWQLNLEVVELTKIPDTQSVMATYQVQLDNSGEFVSYERLRRYARGQIDQ